MKQIFRKSSKGVLSSSRISAIFSVVPDSPVNEAWLRDKQTQFPYSAENSNAIENIFEVMILNSHLCTKTQD